MGTLGITGEHLARFERNGFFLIPNPFRPGKSATPGTGVARRAEGPALEALRKTIARGMPDWILKATRTRLTVGHCHGILRRQSFFPNLTRR